MYSIGKSGIKAEVYPENGKADIEIYADFLWERFAGGRWKVLLRDQQGVLVGYCCQPVMEGEPCTMKLLYPHLWSGVRDPYLYRLEIYAGADEMQMEKVLEAPFPVRNLTRASGKGIFLNGEQIGARAVRQASGDPGSPGRLLINMPDIFCSLVKMGADTLFASDGLEEKCDRLGLLLIKEEKEVPDGIPCLDELFSPDGLCTDLYYRYKADWSSEPFVYIALHSLKKQKNGLFQVMVYSNQKKAALFVNGALFRFQKDGPEFLFQDIPVKGFPLYLTAEAGNCTMSVTFFSGKDNYF